MRSKLLLILLAMVLVVSLAALPACKAEEEAPEEFTLKITAIGEGTTSPASGTSTITEGESVTVTAIPDSGYKFDRWEGDVSGTDDSITFKMTSDKSVVAVFVEEALPEITQVRYLGAPVGSDNFMIGALFADKATKEFGMPCGAFPGGSVGNVKAIDIGEAELGYASCMDAYNGYHGLAPFDKEYPKIRFLARHSTVSLCIAVRMDSDIYEIPDLLRGKKLGIGTGSSTAELFSLYALEAGYDITPEDIEAGGGVVAHISYSEMGAGLADKTLDCVCIFGFPTKVAGKLMAAEERWGIRLLPISDAAMTKISAAYPFIGRGHVEGRVYKGSPTQVTAISSNYIQITSSDLPDDLVYNIMEVLWSDEQQSDVVELCPACPDYLLENCLREGSFVIPVHPGAARWYKDHGMTLPPEAEVFP